MYKWWRQVLSCFSRSHLNNVSHAICAWSRVSFLLDQGYRVLSSGWIMLKDIIMYSCSVLSSYHGLCDSNKLLYKRCAKSMGRPKFRPPLLPHFSTDFNETQNQERYPRYDPMFKIWSMWDDGKRVCVGRALSVVFVFYTFLYSCSRLQVTSEDRSRPFMAQNVCFRVR